MSKRGYLRNGEKERLWRDVLRRHKAGGLSVRGSCREEDVKESAFYFGERSASHTAEPRFLTG